ncbi:MAG: hypothetical protein VX148_02170 [Pseudomonadota bacterium]|nr:hypothetical protein [Pseudomonadota bacterium]
MIWIRMFLSRVFGGEGRRIIQGVEFDFLSRVFGGEVDTCFTVSGAIFLSRVFGGEGWR